MKKYKYVFAGLAEDYYEDGRYIKLFNSFEEAKKYLEDNQYYILLERLYYLEGIKKQFKKNIIVISYS